MKKETLFALAACAVATLSHAAWAAHAEKPVELRVHNTAGGPKLFLDGKAIPPRFLYTPSNNRALEVGTTWQTHELAFTPALPRETCTLHFRFEKNAIEVFLRDVEIVGADGKSVACADSFADLKRFRNAWGVNLEPRCGKVTAAEGGMRVTVVQPKVWHDDFHLYSRPFATTRGTRYRLRFSVKASRATHIFPTVYEAGGKPYQFCPFEGLDVMERQIRLAAASGVHLVSIPVPCAWCADGYDFEPIDAIFNKAIALDPKILILPRFGVDAPVWYLKAHPEARIRFSDGHEEMSVSIAEPTYRRAACAYTEATARHLRTTFPRNFAGLHVNGLSTGEWAYQNRAGVLSGCEPATRDAFRRYLAAHGDTHATTAEVPDETARRAGAEAGLLLRDAVHNPRVSAFARFRQENLTSFLAELGAAVRRGTDNALLSVFFYGYTWDLAGREWGPAGTGHFGLQDLLAQHRDKFDILCAPYSYNSRGWPATGPAMSPAETIGRAGILWLTENDTRTHRVLAWDSMQLNSSGRHPMTPHETEQVLARLTAFDMIRGYGCWWMDLFGHGWYDDPDLWREGLTRLAPLEKAMLARTMPFTPDVAVIADEQGLLDVVPGGWPLTMLLSQHYGYDLCGAPYGQYLLNDFLAHGATARLQFYPLVFALTASQRAALVRERQTHPEKTRVWCWAPGLVGESGVDADNIKKLTGFAVQRISLPLKAKVTSTEVGRAAGLPSEWGFAMPHKVNPLYAVDTQTGDEVWARYEDGSAAVVVRPTKAGGADVFLGTAHLQPAFITAVTRRSGIHHYTEPGQATVCAADGIVALQAQIEGPLEIDFGTNGTVTDLLTNTPVGTGPKLKLPFAKGELRVFRIRPTQTDNP